MPLWVFFRLWLAISYSLLLIEVTLQIYLVAPFNTNRQQAHFCSWQMARHVFFCFCKFYLCLKVKENSCTSLSIFECTHQHAGMLFIFNAKPHGQACATSSMDLLGCRLGWQLASCSATMHCWNAQIKCTALLHRAGMQPNGLSQDSAVQL